MSCPPFSNCYPFQWYPYPVSNGQLLKTVNLEMSDDAKENIPQKAANGIIFSGKSAFSLVKSEMAEKREVVVIQKKSET